MSDSIKKKDLIKYVVVGVTIAGLIYLWKKNKDKKAALEAAKEKEANTVVIPVTEPNPTPINAPLEGVETPVEPVKQLSKEEIAEQNKNEQISQEANAAGDNFINTFNEGRNRAIARNALGYLFKNGENTSLLAAKPAQEIIDYALSKGWEGVPRVGE